MTRTSFPTRLILTLLALLTFFQPILSSPVTQPTEPTPTRPKAAAATPQSTSMFWLDYTKSYDPLAPDPTPAPVRAENGGKEFDFAQTTYYTCITRGESEHCGWHAPILWVAEAAAGKGGSGGGWWGVVVGSVVAGLALAYH